MSANNNPFKKLTESLNKKVEKLDYHLLELTQGFEKGFEKGQSFAKNILAKLNVDVNKLEKDLEKIAEYTSISKEKKEQFAKNFEKMAKVLDEMLGFNAENPMATFPDKMLKKLTTSLDSIKTSLKDLFKPLEKSVKVAAEGLKKASVGEDDNKTKHAESANRKPVNKKGRS
ncbi:MAG: hypothetical protein ACK4OM_00055 [Alphaproteobacteria bacterium]